MAPLKQTYFLSDLHLGARYFRDPREQEKLVCRWLRSIAPDAGRIYLVGDILDYWYEYRNVVPRGFVRFLGTLADLADSGIEITWLIGNHDIWIFDYLPAELGIRVVDGVLRENIDGHSFVIAHGDGLGPIPFAENLMRRTFRCRFLQRLFASVHPRWTVGFAYWWSAKNRFRHHTGPKPKMADPKPLLQWVSEQNAGAAAPPEFYVFGHYHIMMQREVAGSKVTILGDWLSNKSFATFNGSDVVLQQVDLHKHENNRNFAPVNSSKPYIK